MALLAAPAQAAPHVPRELVVKYRAGTTAAEREQIRRSAGVQPAQVVDGQTQAVRVLGGRSTGAAAATLRSNPSVVHAVPNYLAKATGFIPNDPGRGGP